MRSGLHELDQIRKSIINCSLFDNHWNKIIGDINPGSSIEIKWEDGIIDNGYLFSVPKCSPDEGDIFVHIPNPDNSAGMDSAPEVFCHLYNLMTNDLVKSIEIK